MLATEHAAMLEDLSERLLTDFPQTVWRQAFLGPGCEWIRFRPELVTFLASDGLDLDWTPDELEALAARYQGRVELSARRPVLVFPDARKALDAALLLQETSASTMRIALHTVHCTTASFEVAGKRRRITLGGEAAHACAAAEACVAGTIQLSERTYHALGASLDARTRHALVTTELEGDVVTAAAITLPPSRRAALSTFAGLGLT